MGVVRRRLGGRWGGMLGILGRGRMGWEGGGGGGRGLGMGF